MSFPFVVPTTTNSPLLDTESALAGSVNLRVAKSDLFVIDHFLNKLSSPTVNNSSALGC
jgi:hypothetical protein